MKWYRVLSGAFAGSIILVLLGALALTSYHVYHAEFAIPLDHVEDWMVNIIALIPVVLIIMIAKIGFLYLIFSDNRMRLFACMLVGNILIIIATLYFTGTFSKLMNTPPATGQALFKITKRLIHDKGARNGTDKKWVPLWLDKVQKNNKSCCGILTFRDWEEFWPASPENIPQSCCKQPDSSTCVTDFQKIPYPGTPSMFIKTDSGCTDAINEQAASGIINSFIVMLFACILLFCAQLAYSIQFYHQYWEEACGYREDNPFLPIKNKKAPHKDEKTYDKGTGKDCEDPIPPPNNCDEIESGTGSLAVNSVNTPDLASSSVGTVDSAAGSVTQDDCGGQNNGDAMMAMNYIPLMPNGMMNYGPSAVAGTIVGPYNYEPETAGVIVLASSSSSEDTEVEGQEDKPKKKKKRKKKKHHHGHNHTDAPAVTDAPVPNGNDGTDKPDIPSPQYIPATSEDNLVGDRFPVQETAPPHARSGSPRGKILGMNRNRKSTR